ncbi:MAG TPA: RloB domain-containing protein [Clostridiales bacterium]|nr:RloB domain-containing protein [Clostridiales bacterium]
MTEPAYFNQLKALYRESIIDIKPLKTKNSAPGHLIKCAEDQSDLREGDELWIILDVDKWTQEQFDELEKWEQQNTNRHVAVSNPCFEIWLVFHEQDPSDCSKRACQTYFENNIAHGTKSIRINWLTLENINKAIERAKARDLNKHKFVPDNPTSRVYRLIENIDAFCNAYTTGSL